LHGRPRVLGVALLIDAADVADADIACVMAPDVCALLVIAQRPVRGPIQFNDPVVAGLTKLGLVPIGDLLVANVATFGCGSAMHRQRGYGAKRSH